MTRQDDVCRREHAEPVDALRTPFELDRHRIIECTAFRRLEHKTQVFAPAYHDHFRTRLTHSLEVAQLGRCLARALEAHEPLTEAICLGHDLGHPPFGHAGESALDEIMSDQGGFNHNTHSLRVVAYLEHPFPMFRGLNLTAGTLAGLRAHRTCYDAPERTGTSPSTESQIASIADRFAYDIHDLEDAIGAELVTLDDLRGAALWSEGYEKVPAALRDRPVHAIRRMTLDAMLDTLISDVITTTRTASRHDAAARGAPSGERLLVTVSAKLEAGLRDLEALLRERVYRHASVAAMDAAGRRMVRALFEHYRRDPGALPARFAERIPGQGTDRVVCDYIAGMTDRFCLAEYDRLIKRD